MDTILQHTEEIFDGLQDSTELICQRLQATEEKVEKIQERQGFSWKQLHDLTERLELLLRGLYDQCLMDPDDVVFPPTSPPPFP